MKALLDTSVLVAGFYENHEHPADSLEWLLRFPKRVLCGAATLTAMLGMRRATLG